VECRATPEQCRQRLQERARGASISDAGVDLFEEFVRHWEPVDELPEAEHLVMDAEQPLAARLEKLGLQLPTWPSGLVQ
jgi:predicted kinase